MIKVGGTTLPVTVYLAAPGQPMRTITSQTTGGINYFKFSLIGNFFTPISRNITYTLSPVPTNWSGHQIKFTLSNTYSWSNCLVNDPTAYDARLWYIDDGSRTFLYAYPTIAGATIQFF